MEHTTTPPTPVPDAGRRRLLTGGALAAGALAGGLAAAGPASAQEGATQGLVPYAEPFRTYDSREDDDGPIESGETYVIDLSEVPDGALAVLANLTIVDTVGPDGYLTVYGQGRARPGVSTINWYTDGQILANMIVVATGETDNDLLVYNGGAGSTDFIVDVYGYFT